MGHRSARVFVWSRYLAALLAVAAFAGVAGAADHSGQLRAARAQAEEGRLDQAVAICTDILDADPEALSARRERGRFLAWMGRYQAALEDLEAVIVAEPLGIDARILRARVLRWMRRSDEAEVELRSVLKRMPQASEAYTELGNVIASEGHYAEAADLHEQACALAPENPEAWLALGRVRYWQDDLKAARAAYEQALRLAPDHAGLQRELQRVESAEQHRESSRLRLDLSVGFDGLDRGFENWRHQGIFLTAFSEEGGAVFGGLDRYDRFGEQDVQWTLGAWQTFPDGSVLGGRVSVGVNADVVARQVYALELSRVLAPALRAGLEYQRSNYREGISVDLLSPGIEVAIRRSLAIATVYHYAHVSGVGSNHAVSGKIKLFPHNRLSAYLGASYGRETSVTGTVTELRQRTRVTTLSSGMSWRFNHRTGLRLDYVHERREDSYDRHGVATAVFVEF